MAGRSCPEPLSGVANNKIHARTDLAVCIITLLAVLFPSAISQVNINGTNGNDKIEKHHRI
jgi:hypothetical protein